jgi:hypothetical protein
MAHFAQIDSNNIVTQVIVIDNSVEDNGQEFINNDLGLDGTWIQTSFNRNFRGKFAAIGDTYDSSKDLFLEELPHPSWLHNEDGNAVPPIPNPNDGKGYIWDESVVNWVVSPSWLAMHGE